MFKNIFKSTKEVTTNAKVEKLNINELKNVIGGDGGTDTTTPTPDPVDVAKVKAHSNINNN